MSTVRPLWAHQERALNAIASRFAIKDRCQLIMAPGTGKTLVSLRLAEKLARPGLVVVAVPTIALLGQTMAAYMADSVAPHDYLAVCSDPTVEAEAQEGSKGLTAEERRELSAEVARAEDELSVHPRTRVVIVAEGIEAALSGRQLVRRDAGGSPPTTRSTSHWPRSEHSVS